VQRADVILVLEKGRIVEQGTHSELIKAGGLYSKLYQIQFDAKAILRPKRYNHDIPL
jgi:subfamily B ATP-binding cassette protein MsbA